MQVLCIVKYHKVRKHNHDNYNIVLLSRVQNCPYHNYFVWRIPSEGYHYYFVSRLLVTILVNNVPSKHYGPVIRQRVETEIYLWRKGGSNSTRDGPISCNWTTIFVKKMWIQKVIKIIIQPKPRTEYDKPLIDRRRLE